ncbi:MAG: CDP-glycerol glycerophosphotransferase family protein, partial [Sulfurovaceae bacterium]|nr:CDP-glycerol glycerophosphotransferase family protein [Sulfurovaceae bacterium]
ARRKYEKFIDKKKKTILYMPTWGELSSFNIYIDSIIKLNKSYNLLIKLHHNTDYLELGKIDNIKSKNITYFGANDNSLELLSVSDIVISDYSGAIFDAIYCDKPVVLLDLPREKLLKSKKMDIDSLEFNQRDIIGTRVSSTKELELTINSISEKKQEVSLKLNQLKTKLFIQTNSVKKNIENAILDLMNGKYEKTQTQRYINKTVVELYTKRCLWDIIRRRLIEIYLYVISLRRKND